MSRKLRTTIEIDRVYRSTKPHNGKEAGVLYLIKAAHNGGLVTVTGYNPHAPQRKFCTRTIQAKSLAQYNLELIPYESEPEFFMSKEGERIRTAMKAAEPQRIALAKEIRKHASALCNETLLPFSADHFQMSVHGAAEVLRKTMQFASALSQALENQA